MENITKILFIGELNCKHSKRNFTYLKNTYPSAKINVYWSPKDRQAKIPKSIINWSGDILLSYRCYQLIPSNLINSAKVFAINFHPGTPKYPGSCALNISLMNNEKYFGTVTHLMNNKFDSGKILFFDKYTLNYKLSLERQIDISRNFSSKIFRKRVKLLIQNKILENEIDNLIWNKKTYTTQYINKLQVVDSKISKIDLEKRLKWVHHKNFPLYTIICGKKFYLKN